MNSIKDNDPSVPFFIAEAACGFPSPAEDYMEQDLNLHQHLIKHPAATFFVRAIGDSMCDIGILDGDLLIVDRSLSPKHNSIVVAVINAEFTVKRLELAENKAFLCPANKNYPKFAISDLEGVQLWGVVTYAVHTLCLS